jgi:hypothetical protein
MSHISIRDLRKMSGETIGALPGPTPVKSRDEVDPVDWSVEAVRRLMAERR